MRANVTMVDDGENGDKGKVIIPISQYVEEKIRCVESGLQTQLDTGNRIVLEEIKHLEDKVSQEVSHLRRYQGLMTLVYGVIVAAAVGIGSLVVYNTSNVYKTQTEAVQQQIQTIQQQTEAYKKNSDAQLELIREKLGLQDKKIEFYLEKSGEGSKSK